MHGMTQAMLDWNGSAVEDQQAEQDVVHQDEFDTGSGAGGHDRPAERQPAPEADHLGRLSREQVIDEIITCNPSATADFLETFSGEGLRKYLNRLRSAQRARGRGARWIRPNDAPAITAHERML